MLIHNVIAYINIIIKFKERRFRIKQKWKYKTLSYYIKTICIIRRNLMEKIIAKNPTAYHNYSIESTLEAGIVLTGTEIKSIRNGKVNIKDTYITFNASNVIVHHTKNK